VESSFAGLSEPARRSTDRTFHMLSLPEGAAFGMTDQAAQSFQVVARSSAMLASAIQDIARVWLELSQGRWHANFDGFGQLTRCRSTADFLTIQSFLIRSNLEQILDSSRRIAQIAVQAADRAAETLTVEVEKTIRCDKGPT